MKKLITLFLVVCLSSLLLVHGQTVVRRPIVVSGGGGGATLVQSTHVYSGTSIAYASNNSAGNLLIAVISGTSASSPTIAAVNGKSWTQAVLADGSAVDSATTYIFYIENCASGAATVTVSSAPGDPGVYIYEFSGVVTSSALETTATQLGSVQGSTTTPTTGSFNPSAHDLLFYAYTNEVADATFTAGTGYTLGETEHSQTAFQQYKLNGSAGSQTAFATLGTAQAQWAIALAAFKTP